LNNEPLIFLPASIGGSYTLESPAGKGGGTELISVGNWGLDILPILRKYIC
jgi:hypothetical protein